jgi:hypothetical protein
MAAMSAAEPELPPPGDRVCRKVFEHGWALFDRETGARVGPWSFRRKVVLARRGRCAVYVPSPSGDYGESGVCPGEAVVACPVRVDPATGEDRIDDLCQHHYDRWLAHRRRPRRPMQLTLALAS